MLWRFGILSSTPRDLFEQMQKQWFSEPIPLTGDDLADDVVVESPFAAGGPHRWEGKQQFLDFVNPQRATFPVRFDACCTIAIHDTTDPDTIVVEYELTGTSTKTNKQATSAFIAVLSARNGKITLWREYQNVLAIQQALA
jgi:ketosteroid isomerase-like protein